MSGARAFLRELPELTSSAAGSATVESKASLAAYESGVAHGLEQAGTLAETRIADAIESLIARLDDATALRTTLAREAEAEAATALSSVVQALCPDLASVRIAEHAAQMLETYLRAAPRPLIIRAAPEVAERLTELLASHSSDDIRIEGSDLLSGSQVGIYWHEGRAVIDSGALAAQIVAHATDFDLNSGAYEEDSHDE